MGKDYIQIDYFVVNGCRVDQNYLNRLKGPLIDAPVDTDELIFKCFQKNGEGSKFVLEWCVINNLENFIHLRGKLEYSLDQVVRCTQMESFVCVELASPPAMFVGIQTFNRERSQRRPPNWTKLYLNTDNTSADPLLLAIHSDRFLCISMKHKPDKIAKEIQPIYEAIPYAFHPIDFSYPDTWHLPEDRSFIGVVVPESVPAAQSRKRPLDHGNIAALLAASADSSSSSATASHNMKKMKEAAAEMWAAASAYVTDPIAATTLAPVVSSMPHTIDSANSATLVARGPTTMTASSHDYNNDSSNKKHELPSAPMRLPLQGPVDSDSEDD